MKSIVKHILINLLEKKFRTTIVLLTVLLSTLVIFLGLSVNEIIGHTYTAMLKGANGESNIVVSSKDDDPFYEAGDFDTTGVSLEGRSDMISVQGESRIDHQDIKMTLIGINDTDGQKMGLIEQISKVDGFQLENNQSVISNKAATEYGLKLGDKVTVEVNENTYTYEIGAISKNIGVFYGEIDGMHLIVSPKEVNEIYGTENQFTYSYLSVPNDQQNQAIESLKASNAEFIVQNQSTVANTRDEATFTTTMILAIVTIVMISAYIIISLAKLIAVERMPIVGTFRSIGASKRLTNRILTLEFLFYGLIGSILGVIAGALLLPYVADFFNEYKEFGVESEISYNIAYISIAFLFGTLFPPVISLIQIVRVNKRPLKEIILNTSHTAQKQSIVPAIIGLIFVGGAAALHYFNQSDDLILSGLAIISLFISIVLMMSTFLNIASRGLGAILGRFSSGELLLGIKNLRNNKMASNNSNMIIVVFILLMMVGMIADGIDQYLNKSLVKDYDLAVSDMENDPTSYEEIKEIDGVSELYIQYVSVAESRINGQGDGFGVLGVDDVTGFDEFFSGITFVDDAKEQLVKTANGVVLDEYQIDRFDLKIGDTIELIPLDAKSQPLHGDDAPVEAVVAGVMESSGYAQNRSTVLVNLAYFKDHFEGTLNQLNIKMDPTADAEKIKTNITNQYPNSSLTILTFDEILESQKGTINTLISGITVIVLLGLFIGILGISNNLLVSFMQRKKEYAVLYSVCMSRGQIVKVMLTEMFMTFFSVVFIGYLGSLAMNAVMTKLLYAIGLRIDFQFNLELFMILSGVVFLLLLLSTLTIVRKIYQMNIVKSLRFE